MKTADKKINKFKGENQKKFETKLTAKLNLKNSIAFKKWTKKWKVRENILYIIHYNYTYKL